MLHSVFVIILLILPQYVHSSCCRLPFTDTVCKVNRKGPHRYQIMPDRRSGVVMESTECYINDFDASYRKVVETKNDCNDCPGLLVLHTNSSEIFLFPEYLERILEGRTSIQRKNVVVLTTGLVGAYDLDFTLFSRYYATRRIGEVPSFYVDLQMPPFDPKLPTQPTLRLRLPSYNEDIEGLSKISREELLNPLSLGGQTTTNAHQLPYIYHFDIDKHRHPPDLCTLYDVHVGSASLQWKILDSELSTCQTFMPYFGSNKCLATGFTRLFCVIEEHITMDDRLNLSPYLRTTNRVEHLTIATIGNRHVEMSLNNAQMRPAERIKILLLQGHLTVTDINTVLHIRVEYGWNCQDYSIVAPAGMVATKYRRFDAENSEAYEGNSVINLPSCFKVLTNSNSAQESLPDTKNTSYVETKLAEESLTPLNQTYPKIIIDLSSSNTTTNDEQSFISNYWNMLRSDNNMAETAIVLLVLVALIPLCLCVFYRVCCTQRRKSTWTLKHGPHANSAYEPSKDDQTDASTPSYVNNSTQTSDTPIRI